MCVRVEQFIWIILVVLCKCKCMFRNKLCLHSSTHKCTNTTVSRTSTESMFIYQYIFFSRYLPRQTIFGLKMYYMGFCSFLLLIYCSILFFSFNRTAHILSCSSTAVTIYCILLNVNVMSCINILIDFYCFS